LFNPVDRDNMRGIEEEIAAPLPAVEARGLKQYGILLLFEQRIIFGGKRSERGKRPDGG